MSSQHPKQRRFGLTNLAVDNATSVFILAIMIFLFGIQAYQNMPKEQFPEVEWPTVYINTPYFGNSAADIENLITRPIEKELQGITGIKDIKSTSIQDYSVITCEFETDIDLEEAVRKVKDAVDKAKSDLPTDLDQDPTVLDINLSEIPIVTVNISGDYTNDELKEYAELLQDRIEELNEITEVELKGELEREVKVDVDLVKMKALKLSFRDIENAIASENVTISGGELVRNDFRRAIRVIGEFEAVKEMESLIVKSENGRPIYLKELADIEYGYQERTSIARASGLPVISLDVIKRSGENLLQAADKIQDIVEKAKNELPEELSITLFNDQSVNTRNQVNNLENSIISGVILVVTVLLFFLGIRNALFVGIAIPLSMLMGILWLALTGVTLNIVVLFSLILALGLLVDNAIVVVENIYRFRQEGASQKEAAKLGAAEVAQPIIASTATTLAAFVPLAFWPGIMGSFMKYMPITLILVLTSSLFVALVINPVFTSRFLKLDEPAEEAAVRQRRRRNIWIGAGIMVLLGVAFHFVSMASQGIDLRWARNLLFFGAIISPVNFFIMRPGAFQFQNRVLPVLESIYDRFIRVALRFPSVFFLGTILLLFGAIGLLSTNMPKVEFFPSADPLYINAFVELPMGADIEATDRVARELEQRIMKTVEPYDHIVEDVLTQIGENTSDPNAPPEPGSSPNKARITVAFVPAEERGEISTFDIMEEIRETVQGIPGVQVTVDKNADGPATGKPINLEIQGESMDSLVVLSEQLINFFNEQNIPGIEELQADVKIGKPEMIVNIDREAARRYEISTYDIASTIRTAVYGKEASKFKEGEDEYPIMIRLDEKYRNDVEDVLNQEVTFRNASGVIVQVPISAVADFEFTSTYSSIKRKDLDRMVTIFSNVLSGYNANEIIQEMNALMADYPLPAGYAYEFTGEQQQQAEDSEFLSTAFLIALFAIFIIIVAQFNSVISPFIIILTVLFSTIGVLLGYAFSGMDISVVFTGVGIISLAGIVVNNAIVLIDYTDLLVKRRLEERGLANPVDLSDKDMRAAIIKGGATRLRPVLLTAITTILGLVPLAVGFNMNFFTLITDLDPQIFIGGDNAALWGPLAWTVIYGLLFATFLTLIVIPVMYWLSHKLKKSLLHLFDERKAARRERKVKPSVG